MILIADNDKQLRDKLAALLKNDGCDAAAVPLNDTLVKKVKSKKPDLVIAGLVLDKDADDFRRVKSLTAERIMRKRKLLLLVQTHIPESPGLRSKENVEIACDGYLDKPVDVIEFTAVVRSYCSGNE